MVWSTQFYAKSLTDQLRLQHGGPAHPTTPEGVAEPAPVLASLLTLPNDYGLLCLVFATIGVPVVFTPLYLLLLVASTLFLVASLRRWSRRAPGPRLHATADRSRRTVSRQSGSTGRQRGGGSRPASAAAMAPTSSGIDVGRPVAEGLAQHRDVAGQHGAAEAERLDGREPEALVEGQEHEELGVPVQPRQLAVVDPAEEADVPPSIAARIAGSTAVRTPSGSPTTTSGRPGRTAPEASAPSKVRARFLRTFSRPTDSTKRSSSPIPSGRRRVPRPQVGAHREADGVDVTAHPRVLGRDPLGLVV